MLVRAGKQTLSIFVISVTLLIKAEGSIWSGEFELTYYVY